VAGRLSSPRFRRRALRVGIALAAVSGVVLVSIFFWNTGQDFDTPLSDEPAFVPTTEEQVALPKAEYDQAVRTAAAFVATAVKREKTATSFDLVSPALRHGFTREEWAGGDIPVQPYPVDTANWQLEYQYENELGLEVYVVPEVGSQLEPMVFLVTMKKSPQRRWLVDAWVPRSTTNSLVGPAGQGGQGSGGIVAGALPVNQREGRIPRVWLFAPVALLTGVVLVPVALLILERRRNRRAERAYALASSERSSSSSKPS
jgi:hypothetical protein